MKVIWKDSAESKECKSTKYRGIPMTWYAEGRIRGWVIAGDVNVYRSTHSAMNAIDALLGGVPRRSCERRHQEGIQIAGQIKGESL